MDLIFNGSARDSATSLVASVASNNTTARPTFTLGDQPLINLYIGDGAGGYDSQSGDATVTPWLAICTPGSEPTGGTFWLGVSSATSGSLTNNKRYQIQTYVSGDDFTNVGASANASGVIFTKTNGSPTDWTHGSTIIEITTDVAYNATAAVIEAALEATQAIVGVSVIKSGSAPEWLVQWDSVGAVSTMTANGEQLTPNSSALCFSVRTGTSSVTAQQYVRLVQQPYALQTTWSTITNGWQGRLELNTRGLFDFVDGEAKKLATLEFQTVDGSGYVRTVAQIECLVRNEGITSASVIPTPLPSYLTAEESRLAFLQNRYSVTGLTGGGSSLDGVATGTTANPTVATNSFVAIVVSGTAYLYQLVTGTNSESSPDVIRPDDYDGSTNARVWKLRNVGIAAHHATHENGGADEISVAGLSGLLADAQTPLAHATSHKSGGSDAIKLDELAAPTDVTTLNVTASAHGLAPKLSGDSTQYLDGNGNWSVPAEAGIFSLSTTVARSQNYDVLHKRVEGVMTARTTGTTPTVLASTLSLWSAFPDTNPNSVYPSGVLYFEAEVVAHRSGAGTLERAVWKLSGVAQIDTESISFPDAITKDLVSNSFTGGTPDAEFYTNGVSQIGIRATGLNDGSTKFTVWTAHVSLLLSAADKSIVI